MPTPYTEIYLFLAAENNEEAKFLFANKILPEWELYENWLGTAEIEDKEIVALLNNIIARKEIALQNKNYEQAANEGTYERALIRKAGLAYGLKGFRIEAQRDFVYVRCYLLTSIMEKNDLHKGFEKN